VSDQETRILVAEDEQDVRELITYRLTRSGFTVIEAHTGEEALKLAADDPPDLALLDIMMPGLNGYEVTRRMRAAAATRQVPVIFLTARVQEVDLHQGFRAGADDYIKKPFNPDELVARVRAVLGRR